jgi:hypothetical protein
MSRVRHLIVASLVVAVMGCGPSAVASPSTSSTGSPSVPTATATSTASNVTSLSPGAERRADLAYLVEQLKAIHPNPFLDEGEATFMSRVRAIEDRADDLSEPGFLVAVMDLMGHRDRDGHSGAWAMAQTGDLHAWPVWLWDFPDGLRVVAARDPDRDLIGARLVRVGEMAVKDARQAVESLVPRDNTSSLRANLPMYLTLPEVLDELALRGPDGPGLTFELLDGTTRELTTDPLGIVAFRNWVFGEWGGAFPEGLPPDDDGPAHLRNRDLDFWTETLDEPAGYYVGYNAVTPANEAGRSITDLAAEIRAAAPALPDQPFAIDLRNNGGGDNTTYSSLRAAVDAMARERPGRTSIIAGRSTFSAAGNFITDLLVGPERANLRLVGEAPGGGLNIYGDVRVLTLPSSRIVVLVSEDYHLKAPDDDRLALPPDIPVEVTWDDYAAGRDPVLEAAFGG